MGWLFQSLNSSIGKKILMALTGILLILFLLVHLIGNFQLFAGDGGEAFNNYSATLRSLPFVTVIEAALGLLFLVHAINGIYLWYKNKQARPVAYKIKKPSKGASTASRTMALTGSIVFIFLVVHLRTFWYAHVIETHNGTLFDLVVESFRSPVYSGFYILAMAILGFHLNHGFQSAFQTFGWNHSKYFPFIQKLGTIYAVIMAVGFASMPVYFLFFYGGN